MAGRNRTAFAPPGAYELVPSSGCGTFGHATCHALKRPRTGAATWRKSSVRCLKHEENWNVFPIDGVEDPEEHRRPLVARDRAKAYPRKETIAVAESSDRRADFRIALAGPGAYVLFSGWRGSSTRADARRLAVFRFEAMKEFVRPPSLRQLLANQIRGAFRRLGLSENGATGPPPPQARYGDAEATPAWAVAGARPNRSSARTAAPTGSAKCSLWSAALNLLLQNRRGECSSSRQSESGELGPHNTRSWLRRPVAAAFQITSAWGYVSPSRAQLRTRRGRQRDFVGVAVTSAASRASNDRSTLDQVGHQGPVAGLHESFPPLPGINLDRRQASDLIRRTITRIVYRTARCADRW